MAHNSLQSNPSDATDSFVQPDWNSKHGTGTEPGNDATVNWDELYQAQRDGAKARLEGN
jgi:hypothetical protein